MRKFFAGLLAFMLPIVRKAAIQTLADELTKHAYPEGTRRRYQPNAYSRLGRSYYDNIPPQRRRPRVENFDVETTGYTHAGKPFHDVLMVAFDISGPSAREAHRWLMDNMPSAGTGGDNDEIYLDSWWVANDERFDGDSDTSSAVFVKKGNQEQARVLLALHGLS